MMKSLLFTALILTSIFATAQDTCSDAFEIETDIVYTVDVINGEEAALPICTGGAEADRAEWYFYTATESSQVTVTTDLVQNLGRDTRIQIYTGTCENLTCVAGDDDGGTVYLSIVNFIADEGETFYIAFDNRWETDGFDFLLTAEEYVAPPVSFTGQNVTISGSAYGVVDMNGDHLDDIVGVGNSSLNVLYQQASGLFSSITYNHPPVANMPSWSLAAGDIDRNGYTDLLYGGGSGVTFMIANADGLGFTETSGSEYVFSQRSNFIDINNDGHLDAFVCHDVQPNVYYMNDGENNLEFIQGGLGDTPDGGNYGSIWVDYDNDGDMDMFIAKCRGGASEANINQLHRNNGDGTYTEVGVEANLADNVQTWSAAWGDFDNDGFMDAFVGASSLAQGSHKLMMNNGDGTFTDATEGSGYEEFFATSIENITHDFNNDGYLDIRGAGNVIMMNNGDLTFTPVEVPMGNGPAGDLNNDGFIDILAGNTIYFNDGNDNGYIKINTIGAESNINGIGARINLYTPNLGHQIRDVRSGDGFRYMSSMTVHFGIGTETAIDSVVITWPSGIVDVIANPEINTTLDVEEGSYVGVAVRDQFLPELMIYPNPVQQELMISSPIDLMGATIRVFDVNGKKLMDGRLTNNVFNVSQLPMGAYVLDIEHNGRTLQRKFVKQ
jgi:hypothetical protein